MRFNADKPADPAFLSEKPRDLAAFIDIHIFSRRFLRQAWHRKDVARQGDDEAGTSSYAQLAHRDAEPFRASELGRIIR